MQRLVTAISIYEDAVEQLFNEEIANPESRLLTVLLARNEINLLLKVPNTLSADLFNRIVDLDERLKDNVSSGAARVDQTTMAKWRDTLQPAATEWWWFQAREGPSVVARGSQICVWIAIAIALSFIVELLKRFLSGGVDATSTVLQGLVALLVGGTAVQLARQLVGQDDAESSNKPASKSRYLFAISLVIVAVGMRIALPRVAAYYSDQGVLETNAGRLTLAIESYERSVSLKPDDPLAHYNLGLAYESVMEQDKAESEYRAALRWDNKLCLAYSRLAHLQITRHKNFGEALGLLNTAVDKLALFIKEGVIDADGQRRIMYSLLENRGWAQLGLNHFILARRDLLEAQKLRPEAPGAYCLLGQVLVKLGNKNDAISQFESCVAKSTASDTESEAEWISAGTEALSQPPTPATPPVAH